LAETLLRKWAITRYFIFPPHLTSAYAALPGQIGNAEIAVQSLAHLTMIFTESYSSMSMSCK